MNWWKKFLTARKQRDSIKIMLLLAAGAIGFGAGAVSRGVVLYRYINEPVEYVLSGDQRRIAELAELDDLIALSPQQESGHTFLYQGQEYPVTSIALSEEYLSEVYSIQPRGVTETFYMNRPALRQLQAPDREVYAIRLMEDPDGTGGTASPQSLNTTVKLQLEEGIYEQEKSLILTVAGQQAASVDGTGTRGIGQVRICFRKQDLDGSQRKQLENLGFSVENRELVQESEYRKSELLLRMKYEALIGVLLAAGAAGAWKYGKK